MALVKAALKANILKLLNNARQSEMTENEFADGLAEIINNHILTATVTVHPGIPVATPVGPGATSAPGTGRLS